MRPIRWFPLLAGVTVSLLLALVAVPLAYAETPAPEGASESELFGAWVMLIGGGLATVGALIYMAVKKRPKEEQFDPQLWWRNRK
ncbi:MAG: hypothetical protein WCF12_00900 [Propionicimonas sp.]